MCSDAAALQRGVHVGFQGADLAVVDLFDSGKSSSSSMHVALPFGTGLDAVTVAYATRASLL